MSGSFVAANTVWLNNTAPKITDYPFSVGCWIRLAAVGAAQRNIFGLTDTATANNYLLLCMTSTEIPRVSAAAGGVANNATLTTALTAGTWNYVIAQFNSSTSRSVHCLYHTGLIEEAGTTTTRAPTGMDSMQIGHLVGSSAINSPWDGEIAELWYASGRVQPDISAGIQYALIRKLAYEGPFSIPYLANTLVEYLPFRSSVPTNGRYSEPDYYFAGVPRPTWAVGTANLVTLAPHPPYCNQYVPPKRPSGLVLV